MVGADGGSESRDPGVTAGPIRPAAFSTTRHSMQFAIRKHGNRLAHRIDGPHKRPSQFSAAERVTLMHSGPL